MPVVRKTGEVHHNSEEQVLDYALAAVRVADAAELSPEDRAVLLPTIMGQIGSKQVFMEQMELGALDGVRMAMPKQR